MRDYVVLVDEQNNPLGTMEKLAAHNANTPLHRAFSIFLFDEKKQLLLQQRSREKKTWGGVWSNSCCGHQRLNESPIVTAKRRLEYELGIYHAKLIMVLPDYRYRYEKDGIVENEICPILIGMTNETIKPNSDEVQAIKWIDWKTWVHEVKTNADQYTPWCVEETTLLTQTKVFQRFMRTSPTTFYKEI